MSIGVVLCWCVGVLSSGVSTNINSAILCSSSVSERAEKRGRERFVHLQFMVYMYMEIHVILKVHEQSRA